MSPSPILGMVVFVLLVVGFVSYFPKAINRLDDFFFNVRFRIFSLLPWPSSLDLESYKELSYEEIDGTQYILGEVHTLGGEPLFVRIERPVDPFGKNPTWLTLTNTKGQLRTWKFPTEGRVLAWSESGQELGDLVNAATRRKRVKA